MATKLYRVRSTKSDGTEIVWIAFRKEPPVRYAEAIKGASADLDVGERAREAVDELFTYDEAEQLIDYLSKHYDKLRSKIVEEALPLEPTVQALHYTKLHYTKSDVRLRPVVKTVNYPFPDSVEVYEVPDEQLYSRTFPGYPVFDSREKAERFARGNADIVGSTLEELRNNIRKIEPNEIPHPAAFLAIGGRMSLSLLDI